MKKIFGVNILSILLFIVGLILTIGSYFLESLLALLLGVIFILIGLISFILLKALSIFIMDKELNVEALIKAGLTIVKCNNCLKDNVQEDQYCVYCGERLGNENEIQEEHKT